MSQGTSGYAQAPSAVTVAMLGFLLAACGGGGGESAPPPASGGTPPPPPSADPGYTGMTSLAQLNAANAPGFAGTLLLETRLAVSSRPLGPVAGTLIAKSATHKQRQVKGSKPDQRYILSREVSIDSCPEGGLVEIDNQIVQETGLGTVRLSYSDCGVEGTRLNGSVVLRSDAYDTNLQLPTDLTITYSGYSEARGAFSTRLSGTERSVLNGNGIQTTYNVVIGYSPEGVQHFLQNFVFTLSPSSQTTDRYSFAGRLYHSKLGYVEIDTPVAVQVAVDTEVAQSGSLRLRGVGPGTAELSFAGGGALRLTLDENGDGQPERGLAGRVETGIGASGNQIPIAFASIDRVLIEEGESVQLVGSGLDWEGGNLSYQWAIRTGPGGSTTLIGNGPSLSFLPTQPGTYVLELRVSDGISSLGISEVTLTVTDNAAPVARAGNDLTTVEKSPVSLSGGGSTDLESDPLTFQWTLLSAPFGSAAPASVSGPDFSFNADRPGDYVYSLRVADALGFSSDTVKVSVEPLLAIPVTAIDIDRSTTWQEATKTIPVSVSSYYTGPGVTFNVTVNVPWLRIVSSTGISGANAEIVVSVEPAAVESLPNGSHQGVITLTPSGGYSTVNRAAFVSLALPRIQYISPYVLYTGAPTPVTVFGEMLHMTAGATLVVDGVAVQGFSDSFVDSARITLPPLPAGEYPVMIENELGLEVPMSRLVVRDAPVYVDEIVAIPGRPEALEYDAERNALYVISRGLTPGAAAEAYRLHRDATQWVRTNIPVTGAGALSLTADGSRLLVAGASCSIQEFDADTLALLQTSNMPSCAGESFDMVFSFGNGRVFTGALSGQSLVRSYPGFTSTNFPVLLDTVHLLNRERTALLWAEGASALSPRELYVVGINTGPQAVTLLGGDDYFAPGLVSIAGPSRVMHRANVYGNGTYLGALDGLSHPFLATALMGEGDRALVLDPGTDTLSVFDLSTSAPFQRELDISVLADVGNDNRLLLLPDDSVAFVFVTNPAAGIGSEFRLIVRNVP